MLFIVENYDRGMKMLIKISKNPNVPLYLDLEEKGKGKRLKKVSKKMIDSDEENSQNKKIRKEKKLPPIPKLATTKKAVPTIPPLSALNNIATVNQFHEHQELSFLNNNYIPQKISKEVIPAKESSLGITKQFETYFKNTEGCKIPIKKNINTRTMKKER